MPLVTAIITTHKRKPELVQRALDSVLAQTYPNMEIIVVDDSPSEFAYREAIKQLVQEKGAQYIAHEVCQGACVARNTGLAAAKGEFVAFLDDDDEWLPPKIEKQIQKIRDGVALVYCGHYVHNSDTNQRKQAITAQKTGNIHGDLLCSNFIGSTSFPLLRTSVLKEIGGFDPQMQSAQDYDVWLRIAEKYEVEFVPDPLVVYYVYSGERISKSYHKKVAGLERIISKNRTYLKKNQKAYWGRHLELAPYYAGNGQLGRSILSWLKAAARCPLELKENLRHLYWIMRIVAGKQ